MTPTAFISGQRWISSTEPELGLGIVTGNANRRVELDFPAAGEQRTYAIDNAPLNRVLYAVGQQVNNSSGVALTITEREEHKGCLIYAGVDEQGDEHTVHEIDLDSFVKFSHPQDRLFAGQIDKNRSFQLRVETLAQQSRLQQSPVYGLLGPRVQLLPHQLYIASQVAQRHAPRVLLADEVGLGKTIEAGLILHQQLVSGRAQRILVVVPDSLVHQWLVEMLRRFNLMFTILDEARCLSLEGADALVDDADFEEDAETEQEAVNPFESAQLVLCSLDFLAANPERQQQAVAAGWDLLVVDEAHHLGWSEEQVSAEYACVEALSQQSLGLLLLTATPEQLGVASHFARLRLLDPERYYSLAQFQQEEQSYQPVSDLVEVLLSDDVEARLQADAGLLTSLADYLGGEADTLHKALAAGQPELIQAAVQTSIRHLLDRHGTGRVLFRNTRDNVAGFPARFLNSYPLPAADEYGLRADTAASLQSLICPELLLGENWTVTDARVAWLVEWLQQNRTEKALVICARADTALALEEYLRVRQGLRSAVFHEGMSLINRDRAAAYFAEPEDGAQLLICSEIGSEGRNFQFARHLVLFDLPLNPDLLEQRIGRLDRIGQRHTVQIHVPYYQDSAQAVLLRWYHEGLNAFETICPAGTVLFDRFQQQLQACLYDANDAVGLEQLIDTTRTVTEQTLEQLSQGRNHLLELNSFNGEAADEVVAEMIDAGQSRELAAYVDRICDEFGVEQHSHGPNSVVLQPGDHMQYHSFPGLSEEGLTGSYNRDEALSREDLHFLTWEHPLVSGAMDMVLSGGVGNTALCTIKLGPLPPGTLLLEAIFALHCPAPKHFNVQRYVPEASVRLLLDAQGKDLGHILTYDKLNDLAGKVPRHTAQQLVRQARSEIETMVGQAEQAVTERQATLIAEAQQRMQALLGEELNRLQALAQVNPNIRAQEVEHIQQTMAQLEGYLAGAQLQLEAIRVVISV